MARKILSDIGVAGLKPRASRYAFPDPQLVGHYVRVQPNGSKSFVAVARNPWGKQVWVTLGATDVLKIDEAREKARGAIKRVNEGLPPVETPVRRDTFDEVADNWLKRHVAAKGLRSEKEIRRLLSVHVRPKWGDKDFLSVRRSEVTALLDHVEDNHGARQADYVLAIVRGICNWYAARHDNYTPPTVRGMRRTNPKERERERVLTDEELRAIWHAAERNGTFGAIIQLLLLTAQRRQKVASMRWDDIKKDVWTIAANHREKGNAGKLKLPRLALQIIERQSKIGDNPFVFAGRGSAHFNGFSKAKRAFDAALPEMPQWQLHDLRRTARSLMSRAGVASEIAERLLGHAVEGVEGVYDRHKYTDEMAEGLTALAALVTKLIKRKGRSP